MLKDVVEVRPLASCRLHLVFEDGVAGEVDLAEFVPFTGVFEPLRGPEVFAQVRVDPELGTVVWPNGADLDPDVLYARVSGEPIPSEARGDGRAYPGGEEGRGVSHVGEGSETSRCAEAGTPQGAGRSGGGL